MLLLATLLVAMFLLATLLVAMLLPATLLMVTLLVCSAAGRAWRLPARF
jgi:hypothetical protein